MSKISKRIWRGMKKREQIRGVVHVSNHADNRFFCEELNRNKFLYKSEKIAKTALGFNNGHAARYYWCESCSGYHLTHLSQEAYENMLFLGEIDVPL